MANTAPIEVHVVEDDDAMRTAMSRVLEAAGFRLRSFPSAEALLGSSADVRPTCFVIDINLPGISGLELAARLAKSERAAPFIFITGNEEVVNRRRALAAGASAFLPKPFPGRTLVEAVIAASLRTH